MDIWHQFFVTVHCYFRIWARIEQPWDLEHRKRRLEIKRGAKSIAWCVVLAGHKACAVRTKPNLNWCLSKLRGVWCKRVMFFGSLRTVMTVSNLQTCSRLVIATRGVMDLARKNNFPPLTLLHQSADWREAPPPGTRRKPPQVVCFLLGRRLSEVCRPILHRSSLTQISCPSPGKNKRVSAHPAQKQSNSNFVSQPWKK
jgi:hypothetical protein